MTQCTWCGAVREEEDILHFGTMLTGTVPVCGDECEDDTLTKKEIGALMGKEESSA